MEVVIIKGVSSRGENTVRRGERTFTSLVEAFCRLTPLTEDDSCFDLDPFKGGIVTLDDEVEIVIYDKKFQNDEDVKELELTFIASFSNDDMLDKLDDLRQAWQLYEGF